MKRLACLVFFLGLLAACSPPQAPRPDSPMTVTPTLTVEAVATVAPSPLPPTATPVRPPLGELMATPGSDYLNAQLDAAEAGYRAIAGLYPESAEPWLGLASIASRRGEPEAAEVALRRALETDPGSREAWRELGVLQAAADDWEGLHQSLTALIELAPGAELYRARAIASARLADAPAAVADLMSAENLQPFRLDGWSRAASSASALRDYETALAIAEAGLQQHPEEAALLFEKAFAQLSLGDDLAAMASLDGLLAVAPDHVFAHFWRSRLLDRAGREEEALEEALFVAEAGISSGISDEILAFEAIADAADLITRLEEASVAFEYVAQQVYIHGSRDELLLAYARIDWRRGSTDAARDRLAVLAATGYEKANLWLGILESGEGEDEAARAALTAFTEGITFGPEAETAHALLADLVP